MFTYTPVFADIDPLLDIGFLQSGILHSIENQFHISNELNIREFPYITYSKILDEKIDTHGSIFINNQFQKLSFSEKIIQTEQSVNEKDDLEIVVQYTQRAHSKQPVFIDVKIFDKEQNKHNYFNQNYGQISNVNVQVSITDENNQEVFSFEGITNEGGLIETKYLIPDNSRIETLTVTINAENENSISSKILQVFVLGNLSNNG
jgi:hypothetical protein